LANRIRETVNNAQQATADLGHASRQAAVLVSDLNSRQISQKAGEMIDNLNDSPGQVHQVISEMNKPDECRREHQGIAHECEYGDRQSRRHNRGAETQLLDPRVLQEERLLQLKRDFAGSVSQ
jgi:hypothetical protein